MQKLIILATTLLIAHGVLGQQQYQAAKIVYTNGDSANVYLSNFSSCKEIQVKTTDNAKPQILNAKNVKEYVYEGNYFVSKIVTITNYKFTTNNGTLIKTKEDSVTTDTLFLKKVLVGKVNLYSVLYSNNERYLFIEKGPEFYEIPQNYEVLEIDEATKRQMKNIPIQQIPRLRYSVTKRQDYINVLQVVLNDEGQYRKVPDFYYSEKTITDLVTQYNKQNGAGSGLHIEKKARPRVYFGIDIGSLYPLRDVYFDPKEGGASLAFNAYLLFPMGYDRNTFFKLSYNNYSYLGGRRAVRNVGIGFRKASLQGVVRPYVEIDLTAGYQYVESYKSTLDLANSIELGFLVPVKTLNITAGIVYTPISFAQHGYRFIGYSVGLLF